jgi:hypothetical protein
MRWVTERRPHVDRCASAWFIHRFVDTRARFLFVERGEPPPRGAIPYDLPSAALGHRAGKVTFDAFLSRYRRRDRGLTRLANLVRDIDLGRFRIPESRGLDTLLYGLLLVEPDDGEVVRRTAPLFEGLYRYFREEGRT